MIAVVVCALVSTAAAAPTDDRLTCTCGAASSEPSVTGLVWRGRWSPAIADIAGLVAPVLWFSPDEPLLTSSAGPIPGPAPCDAPSLTPIVYYKVVGVQLTGHGRVFEPIEREPDLFRKASRLYLKYSFYYPWDQGINAHQHDLEAVDVEVGLRQRPGGCREVSVRRVTGLAHGLSWYANILKVEPDMKLPPAVLIEEGKHAVCPDRNADGVYTPRYDVNARVRDAWGIRDTIANGEVLGMLYRPSRAKRREPAWRLLPPIAALPSCVAPGNRSFESDEEPSLGRYALRRADDVPACPAAPDQQMLTMLRRTQRFGKEYPLMQHDLALERELATTEAPSNFLAGVALRYDERAFGASVMLRGFDVGRAWLVPRFGWTQRANKTSAELLITRSASRWIDPYASVGWEHARAVYDLSGWSPGQLGSGDVDGPPVLYARRDGMVTEAGLKFRLRVTGRARWATLGYTFGGVRVGVRANGTLPRANIRMVIEIGPGVW